MRVIVDTNIIVSGLISSSGPPAKIVNALLQGLLIPVLSPDTLAELEAVLMRPRLQALFSRAGVEAEEFLAEFHRLAEIIESEPVDILVRDEKDRIFLELAATRPPVDFLITGDKDFERQQYAGVPVISATLFVRTVLP
ncbi:MAG: putative toxin-antitoxin system toxin component, PIN family [Nitrospirae bacterium]|nr:putative toxin-antitoxin system toxin component, PIN family [Nitrospirota bacterium]